MLCLPAFSLTFPQLLNTAKSLPPNSSEQLAVVTTLFVWNRVYLYLLAGAIVGLAALRGAGDSVKLGERITDLTEELLFRPSVPEKEEEENMIDDAEKPAIIQSLTKGGFKESLDEISSEKQALFLPVVVSILLATSVVLLPFWSGGQSLLDGGKQESLSFLASLQNVATTFLPKISQAWNFALLTFFTRSELGRLGNEINLFSIVQNEKDSDTDYGSISIEAMEWIVAVGIVSLAFFFQQWPAQNFVNMALATLVARAIQLDTFSTVVAALGLLTLYDAATVFLVPAANAADVPLATVSASGSAMGSVAIQKLTSNTFQPGLLTTKIGNSLGGSLGLGDAVFPSLLATFCRRFDLQQEKEDTKINRPSLFAVSMGGYFLGCLTCEFAPMISSSGIPALVFIIPMMLASIIISATLSDDLENLIRFDPNASREIAIDETGERGG